MHFCFLLTWQFVILLRDLKIIEEIWEKWRTNKKKYLNQTEVVYQAGLSYKFQQIKNVFDLLTKTKGQINIH